MRASRRLVIVFGVVGSVLVVLLVAGVIALVRFERAVVGPCHDREATVVPGPVLGASQLDREEQRNLVQLNVLRAAFGPPQSVTRLLAHQCPNSPDVGGIVGLSTAAKFAAPAVDTRCDFVRRIEALLGADGWITLTLETSDPAAPDRRVFGPTNAWRDDAHMSVEQSAATVLTVTVYQHVGVADGAPPASQQSSCGR